MKKTSGALMILTLKYNADGEAAIMGIKRISTPGQRIYVRSNDLKKIKGGYGRAIVSTSRGLMIGEEARKQKLGGEYICQVW